MGFRMILFLLFVFSLHAQLPSNATTLASKMGKGWNLGNSLEACSSSTSASETMWGNPKTSQAFIDAIKAAGFTTIRLPTAWSGYLDSSGKISEDWLARVKEVVQYCTNNSMYVVLNEHWDGGWLEENPFYSKQKENNEKLNNIWTQIATYFRDFDEHLLFAGMNEVHADYGTPTTEHIEVHNSYVQTFVDAVRATGGNNANRNLVIQGYNTNIEHTKNFLQIPKDPASNRLFIEVHFYDPWDFTGDQGSGIYLWGSEFKGQENVSSWGQEDWVDEAFNMMSSNFVRNGYPVILGEYSPTARLNLTGTALINHKRARANWVGYVTKTAVLNGMIPYYWDNGGTGNNGCGIFDRETYEIVFPELHGAIFEK